MKSTLQSIKPKWCALILNGKKTIEVRTTAPKDWLDYLSGKTKVKPEPSTVYIYCSKNGDGLWYVKKSRGGGYAFFGKNVNRVHNGKVIAKYTLREVEKVEHSFYFGYIPLNHESARVSEWPFWNKACLTPDEVRDYGKGKNLYGWHISDLEIFDEPKELSEFLPVKWDKCGVLDEEGLYQCDKCPYGDKYNLECKWKPLTRAPQSWCYVEELK